MIYEYKRERNGKDMKQYLCIGTYTEPILFGTGEVFQGKGKGISLCVFEEGEIRKWKELEVCNPSFVCIDEKRKRIYAVNERKEYLGRFGGGVTEISYNEEGSMKVESTYNTEGTDPCHIILSPDGSFLAIANFASGALSIFELEESGAMTGERKVFRHEGRSVHPIRQKGPHAHSAVFSPDGRYLYVPDLGLDLVKAYTCRGKEVEAAPESDFAVPAGSGPRFGEFGKDGHHFYLIHEIASQVMHFYYDNGKMVPRETVSTLPDGFSGENICSDLHITPDGRYLYASNRGHDSLACCRILEDGSLDLAGWQESGGRTPRNFCIDPRGKYVLVGNQDSDNIVVFRILEDGRLKEVSRCDWGSPVCIRVFP